MSADTQSVLFQPFLVTKAGELRNGRGTGVGLSIAKELIAIHGGTILVTSSPSKGSTFTVVVPFRMSDCKVTSEHLSLYIYSVVRPKKR